MQCAITGRIEKQMKSKLARKKRMNILKYKRSHNTGMFSKFYIKYNILLNEINVLI